MGNEATIFTEKEGTSLSVAGNTYRTLIGGSHTAGKYAVIDMLVPPGGGPGPHAHPAMTEDFYIIEGEVEFTAGTQKHIAQKGDYVHIPLNGPVHFFKNKSGKMAHMVCTVTPAGLEDFFAEVGRPVANGEFLPFVKPTPEQMEHMVELGKKYGQEFFPPD